MIIKSSTKYHAQRTARPMLSGTVDSSARVKRLYKYLRDTMWKRVDWAGVMRRQGVGVNPDALELIYYGGLIAGIIDDLSS